METVVYPASQFPLKLVLVTCITYVVLVAVVCCIAFLHGRFPQPHTYLFEDGCVVDHFHPYTTMNYESMIRHLGSKITNRAL